MLQANKQRPQKPSKNAAFPTKIEIAISMVSQFNYCFSRIEIKFTIKYKLNYVSEREVNNMLII